ncbi:hypothetical protein B0T22DRAFT_459328 [Podospora appendiculata]|uniref:Transmembrane protein n=1 Tax=Podospora appendiculata TaxID=314037 RepID=A0AAE0XA00_9PEZI|nr:hypothetical protein B0T22DRAFT_459328 [Podospora appendiculata]
MSQVTRPVCVSCLSCLSSCLIDRAKFFFFVVFVATRPLLSGFSPGASRLPSLSSLLFFLFSFLCLFFQMFSPFSRSSLPPICLPALAISGGTVVLSFFLFSLIW